MTRYRRKMALSKIYEVFSRQSCSEAELVLEAALQDTVLRDTTTYEFLQTQGLKLHQSLASSKVQDKQIALKKMEELVLAGRNKNTYRALSVDHAVAVVDELGLSLDHYGDIQRLKEAIRLEGGVLTINGKCLLNTHPHCK